VGRALKQEALRLAAPTVAAALAAALGLALMKRLGAQRPNFAGRSVPSPAGFIYAAGGLAGIGAFAGLQGRDLTTAWLGLLCTLFTLGLLDDLFGGRAGGGFRGHFREAIKGRFTTAFIKAAGCGLAALWASCRLFAGEFGPMSPAGYLGWTFRVALGALVTVLAANAANLLDLRPGRAAKAVFVCLALLVPVRPLPWAVSMLGPVALGGWLDLRGRLMMGDSGANLLGGIVGFTFAGILPAWGLAAACIPLIWINLYSEWKSITRLIETTPVLRALDRLGRRY
jgi:UDP-GlcNAc:undecaprenyl-phosphate GlcNAc-1-phosphate transferase